MVHLTGQSLPENAVFRTTLCLLSPSQVPIHVGTLPSCALSWAINLMCGSLSKALVKSRKTTSIASFLSTALVSLSRNSSKIRCARFSCHESNAGWILAVHYPAGVSWDRLKWSILVSCNMLSERYRPVVAWVWFSSLFEYRGHISSFPFFQYLTIFQRAFEDYLGCWHHFIQYGTSCSRPGLILSGPSGSRVLPQVPYFLI